MVWLMEAEALAVSVGWHPFGSSVWMPVSFPSPIQNTRIFTSLYVYLIWCQFSSDTSSLPKTVLSSDCCSF